MDRANTNKKVSELMNGLLESFREVNKLEEELLVKRALIVNGRKDFEKEASKLSLFIIKLGYEAEGGIMSGCLIGCFSSKGKAEELIDELGDSFINGELPKFNLFAVSGKSMEIIAAGVKDIEGNTVFGIDTMTPAELKKDICNVFNKSNL